jgi:hypothetical protein
VNHVFDAAEVEAKELVPSQIKTTADRISPGENLMILVSLCQVQSAEAVPWSTFTGPQEHEHPFFRWPTLRSHGYRSSAVAIFKMRENGRCTERELILRRRPLLLELAMK